MCSRYGNKKIALYIERYESEFMRVLKELVKDYGVFFLVCVCVLKCYSFLRELLDFNKTLR